MKNCTFILALLLAPLLRAQEKPLTLKDAVNYALLNKAEAKKGRLDVENSEYQIQEVRSRALPQIALNGNLTYNPVLQLQPFDLSAIDPTASGIQFVAFGQKWSTLGGANLTQNLFDLSVFTGLKAASTTREFYKVNAQLTDEQVIERVANNYYQVFVQKQHLALTDSTYATTQKTRNIIQGQFDNGLARKIDLDRIVVSLNNIAAQRQQLRTAVKLQENALKFYMGMPMDTPVTLAPEDFEVKPLNTAETPDIENRTEFRALKTQEQLLTYNKKAIQAEYFPTLAATANFNYFGTGQSMPWFKKPDQGVFYTHYSAIGLNLHIPIFTGFGTRARVRQADVEIRKLQADIDDTKLALAMQFENAKTKIENNLATVEIQRKNVQLAQEVLSNTENNYYNGLATLTDLLNAESALTEAQNNYTTALLDYKLAEIELIKSKGQLKTLTN